MTRKFFIIDGHSQIWRAFFAQAPPLRSPDNEPTKATYIFTRGLLKMLREHTPDYLCMTCDSGRKHLLRRKFYSKYKTDRKSMPPELLVQVARIKHIVMGLGIPLLAVKGYEADDIIATLVDCCSGLDMDIVIVSRDKDLMQLVNSHVRMYDPLAEEWFDKRAVLKHWGVPPKRVVEVQTLMGDGVDCVPAIWPGIGEKRAVTLIKQHKTAEHVLDHIAEGCDVDVLPKKLRAECMEKVDKLRRRAWRNRQLVDLCRTVPLELDAGSLNWRGLDLERVRPIFRTLGFKRWE